MKHVSVASVVRRIDQDLKVVVEFLTDIAVELRGGNFPRLRIKTRDSEVDFAFRIEDAHLGALRGRLSFVRLSLAKVSNRNGGLPQWVIKSAIELWRMLNGNRLSYRDWFLSLF